MAIKYLKILVCDNQQINQQIIYQLLSSQNTRIRFVSDNKAMLFALGKSKYDVVITDLDMAGLNSITALEQYKSRKSANTSTRFILLTGGISAKTRAEAENAGFDALLAKPINANNLLNTIQDIAKIPQDIVNQWSENNALPDTNNIKEFVSNSDILDTKTLNSFENIAAGDSLFIRRLLKNYLTNSSDMLQKIDTALENRDYEMLQDTCRVLQGNSLSVGAFKFYRLTNRVKTIDDETTHHDAMNIVGKLQDDFMQLKTTTESYLKEPKVKQYKRH